MISFLRKVKNKFTKKNHEWFTGDYATWEDAKKNCTGYDAPNILEKVKTSLLKVKNGEAIYERDSVLFDHVEYSYPLLVSLLYIATASGNKLELLDFGGSLGSSYFQNKKFLDRLNFLKWCIVEQKQFVDCGIKYFQNENLRFYHSIEDCISNQKIDGILFSSVLQYLVNPLEILQNAISSRIKYIIIDRVTFFKKDFPDRITIQTVPPEVYDAQMPIWIFNRTKFENYLKQYYRIIESMKCFESWQVDGLDIETSFYLLELNN